MSATMIPGEMPQLNIRVKCQPSVNVNLLVVAAMARHGVTSVMRAVSQSAFASHSPCCSSFCAFAGLPLRQRTGGKTQL